MKMRVHLHNFLKTLRRKKLILGALFIAFSASMSGCGQTNEKSAKNKTAFPETKIPLKEASAISGKGEDTLNGVALKKNSKMQKNKIKVRNDSLKQQDFINTCYFRIMNK
jgi:hypothetical protein